MNLPADSNLVDAVTVQKDGKIVEIETQTVASYDLGTDSPLVIRRFNPDGSIDTTFATNGVYNVPLDAVSRSANPAGSPYYDAIGQAPHNVAIDSFGDIVFAFSSDDSSFSPPDVPSETSVYVLSADGQQLSKFGIANPTGAENSNLARLSLGSVAIQSDGKIVAAGTVSVASATLKSVVLRLDTNLEFDTSFNQTGEVVFAPPGSQSNAGTASPDITPLGLQLDSSGQISLANELTSYVGSSATPGPSITSELTRINPDGTLDSSFGTNGTLSPGLRISGLAVQPDGKVVLAGSAVSQTSPDGRYVLAYAPELIRLNTDGTTDTTYSGITAATATRFVGVSQVAQGTDGTINLIGTQANGLGLAERFLTNGLPDPNFGLHGLTTFRIDPPADIDTPYQQITSLAVTPSGNLVIAGGVGLINYGLTEISISRSFLAQTSAMTSTSPKNVTNDYDGDGISDIAAQLTALGVFAYRKSTGGDVLQGFGIPGIGQTIPAPGDYDGDGKTDVAAYFPALGEFGIRYSSGIPDQLIPFGIPGAGQAIPAPGDYDGDGKTDLAVYLPALGEFGIRPSAGGADELIPFGASGSGQSIPAPGDYDGDGVTDLAVYLPALGEFGIRPSSGGADELIPFGVPGSGQAIPTPGDYDGDGKTDLSVYLPALGDYAYRPSGGGADVLEGFGGSGAGFSIPAPGDYDGDGKTDIAVYLPSLGLFAYRPTGTSLSNLEQFGASGTGQTVPAASIPSAQPSAVTGFYPNANVSAASVAVNVPLTGDVLEPMAIIKKKPHKRV